MQIGYCGNVHPGRTVEEVKRNLTKYTLDIKSQVRPSQQMGIGLWLSATAAGELDSDDYLIEFRDWLADNGLLPFTLNGFPYGDFHQTVVKHDVYRPTWADTDRLDYTIRLAEILDVLLPEGVDGTISTLPLGWPADSQRTLECTHPFWETCAKNLRICAERLDEIAQSSGRNVFVCIEPEPGCILDSCEDVIGFFDQHLMTGNPTTDQIIRNHVGVCHDVCHSSVMFEDQSKAIREFAKSEIRIGKIQVSSAINIDFDSGTNEDRMDKKKQLASFVEPKYLHQTSVRIGGQVTFYEDLDQALENANDIPQGQWRVHFHVPIYSESLGLIGTTQSDIRKCIDSVRLSGQPLPHFEVETYAWNVLPEHLKQDTLADGIAREIEWFDELMSS